MRHGLIRDLVNKRPFAFDHHETGAFTVTVTVVMCWAALFTTTTAKPPDLTLGPGFSTTQDATRNGLGTDSPSRLSTARPAPHRACSATLRMAVHLHLRLCSPQHGTLVPRSTRSCRPSPPTRSRSRSRNSSGVFIVETFWVASFMITTVKQPDKPVGRSFSTLQRTYLVHGACLPVGAAGQLDQDQDAG